MFSRPLATGLSLAILRLRIARCLRLGLGTAAAAADCAVVGLPKAACSRARATGSMPFTNGKGRVGATTGWRPQRETGLAAASRAQCLTDSSRVSTSAWQRMLRRTEFQVSPAGSGCAMQNYVDVTVLR